MRYKKEQKINQHSREQYYDPSIMDKMFDEMESGAAFTEKKEWMRLQINRITDILYSDSKKYGALSDRERQCFSLAFIKSMSKSDIASELKISKFSVNTHLKRAKVKIKDILIGNEDQLEFPQMFDERGNMRDAERDDSTEDKCKICTNCCKCLFEIDL